MNVPPISSDLSGHPPLPRRVAQRLDLASGSYATGRELLNCVERLGGIRKLFHRTILVQNAEGSRTICINGYPKGQRGRYLLAVTETSRMQIRGKERMCQLDTVMTISDLAQLSPVFLK